MSKRRVLVLDTSAFIMGYNPLSSDEEQYSTPTVKEELRPGETPRLRFEVAESLGKLRSISPPAEHLAELEATGRYTQTSGELSRADREVVALALKLRGKGLDPLLVTDDYDLQNVAEAVGIRYTSLANLGIRYRYDWVLACPGCRRVYPATERSATCRICGAALKRRVGRAEKALRRLPKP
ncbi:MAG: hypothetical protein QW587_04300 [Candidatus Bathyarchaeia archaeon]